MQTKYIGIMLGALGTVLLTSCSGGGGGSSAPANPYDGTWNIGTYAPYISSAYGSTTCTGTPPATVVVTNGSGSFPYTAICPSQTIPMTVNFTIGIQGSTLEIRETNSYSLSPYTGGCTNTSCSIPLLDRLYISR